MAGELIPRPLYGRHDLVLVPDATIGCPDCDGDMTLIEASMCPPAVQWYCFMCGSELREYE
jgi:hypothetical protein